MLSNGNGNGRNKDYLDPRWQRKRLKVLERDSWRCIHCGQDRKPLHAHHTKYIGTKPWHTPIRYIVTLCESCHLMVKERRLSVDPKVDPTNFWELHYLWPKACEQAEYLKYDLRFATKDAADPRNTFRQLLNYARDLKHGRVGTWTENGWVWTSVEPR